MNWVGIFLLIIHVIACTAVILIVLLQAGKGASLGAAFGGGSGQTMFGARSATFIGRMTWVLAGVFMLTSLLLTMVSPWGKSGMETGSTILQEEPLAAPPLGESSQPALPATNPLPDDALEAVGHARQEETAAEPEAPIESPAQPEESTPQSPAEHPSEQP